MQLLVLDVDGVMTDGGLWFDGSGQLIKRFDVRIELGLGCFNGWPRLPAQWWLEEPRKCDPVSWASSTAWWGSRTRFRPLNACKGHWM